MVDVYGETIESLGARWHEGLWGRLSWAPLANSPDAFLILVSPMFALAWWRRRRRDAEGFARLLEEDRLAQAHRERMMTSLGSLRRDAAPAAARADGEAARDHAGHVPREARGRATPGGDRRCRRRAQSVIGGDHGTAALRQAATEGITGACSEWSAASSAGGGSCRSPGNVRGVRPTSSKLRGAIFDRLQGEIVGARFLDPFAGSGAVSIEALSRGASSATLVEKQRALVQFLGRQLAALGLDGRATVRAGDAARVLRAGATPHEWRFSIRPTRIAPSMARWRGGSWRQDGSRPAR